MTDANTQRPLVVDLDGTLVYSNMVAESALIFVRHSPARCLDIVRWRARGMGCLKAELAHNAPMNVAALPYNTKLITYLQTQKAAGRRLVLACGVNRRYGQAIANHVDLFDDCIASGDNVSLTGYRKLEAIRARANSDQGFDYAADRYNDRTIWRQANHAILVNASPLVTRLMRRDQAIRIAKEMPLPSGIRWRGWLRAVRPRTWQYTTLATLPLFWGILTQPTRIMAGIAALTALFTVMLAVHVTDDLLDLPEDRMTPGKQKRPFVDGSLRAAHGLLGLPVLTGYAATTVIAYLPLSAALTLVSFSALLTLMQFGHINHAGKLVLSGTLNTLALFLVTQSVGVQWHWPILLVFALLATIIGNIPYYAKTTPDNT